MHAGVGIAAKARPAGDVDDGAAAMGAEMADGAAAELAGSRQVDPQGALPGGQEGIEVAVGIGGFVDAGVVDQDVDAALPSLRSIPHGLGGSGIGEVAADGERPARPRGIDQRLGGFATAAVVDDHVCAQPQQHRHRRRPDAARAAGHQHRLSRHVDHGISSFRL